jgi:sphingomyelin phosphodiesterase acid-like 3
VMAHIPPGIDPYSTAMKSGNLCAGKAPQMFLSSEALAETLAEYGDVIRLAIFAHTHMDEVRLLEPAAGGVHGPVAVKMVPSISPVDGNDPAFTVAVIDPATATLADYRVFAASNQTGVGTAWSEEYDFAEDFAEPAFSAAAVADLLHRFEADGTAQMAGSEKYLSHYFVGAGARELKPFWPMYVCALNHDDPGAYRACVCAGK